MSRKDYVAIAAAIRNTYDSYNTEEWADDGWSERTAIRLVAEAIADELAYDNPSFDRQRFLAAAVDPEVEFL